MDWIIQISTYFVTFLLMIGILLYYLKKQREMTTLTEAKIAIAKEEGRFEPVSLHPYIDLSTCIGSGACITSCPEKDILGLTSGKVSVINASNCVGHGACFHACPVEAISLRIGTESRGVELPHVNHTFESNIRGIFIAGELGGMGLIKNSVEQGVQAVENIVKNLKSPKEGVLDLAIIGAGPAGIAGMLKAKELGITCQTFEQYTLGGTVYSFPRAKIVMTSPMDLPLYGKIKLYDTSKEELLGIWNDALSRNGLTIKENTKIENIIPKEDGTFILVTNNNERIAANQVLIAIGRRGTPRKLGIKGEDKPKVYYRLLEPENISGKNILVVGGGDSAVESAMLLMENNKVTLSYRKDKFARIKIKNRDKISEAIENGRLNMIFNSNLIEIMDEEAVLKIQDDEVVKIENDLVYVFIGGELPSNFLKQAGIEIKKRFGYIMKQH